MHFSHFSKTILRPGKKKHTFTFVELLQYYHETSLGYAQQSALAFIVNYYGTHFVGCQVCQF